MTDFAYTWLSHPWSGFLLAAIPFLFGSLLLLFGRNSRQRRIVGVVLVTSALTLSAGATRGTWQFRRARAANPPPGKLVDVGGYRMHILAEGPTSGTTVVWIPGSHNQGLEQYHLHKALRGEIRSVMFDRPGTGWSDPGPYPRSTALEAVELATLLEKAGERGPFIPVGHSYGGLLAANFARRYADRVTAAVLLDPSPPDAFIYAPVFGVKSLMDLAKMCRKIAFLGLFGIRQNPDREAAKVNPEMARVMKMIDDRLGDVQKAMDANALHPAACLSTASVFSEFFPERLVAEGPQLMVYDGDLGPMPLYLVTPNDDYEQVFGSLGLAPAEKARVINFFKRSRVRYLQASSASEWITTPTGTSHLFPLERPDFVLDVVRKAVARTRDSSHTAIP